MENESPMTKKDESKARVMSWLVLFFAMALPALSILAGTATHNLWVELAAQMAQHKLPISGIPAFLLEHHAAVLWTLLVLACGNVIFSIWSAAKSAGTSKLVLQSRAIVALAFAGTISVLYLTSLVLTIFTVMAPLFR